MLSSSYQLKTFEFPSYIDTGLCELNTKYVHKKSACCLNKHSITMSILADFYYFLHVFLTYAFPSNKLKIKASSHD